MKSQSGSFMTFSKGMMNGNSTKQKLNTTSSTRAEVVAVHDNMGALLWTRYFLEEQGYPQDPSVLYQDNQGAMLLENNGRSSSGKHTRHIEIRYFFVTDCVKRGHIEIRYCPTDDMIGDFFTKPVQGSKFQKFRNIIMNSDYDEYGLVDPNDGLNIKLPYKRVEPSINDGDSGSQECVGVNSEWKLVKNNKKSCGKVSHHNFDRVQCSSRHQSACTPHVRV
jgi:hypothetical protein